MKIEKVAIIGAGEIGLALGKLISSEVFYWDKDSSKLKDLPGSELSLPEIIDQSQVIFLCLPSWGLKEAMFCLSPYLKPGKIIITLSKGLEESSRKTGADFIAKAAPKCLVGHLGGPMIAEEIQKGLPGVGILASKDKKVFVVADLFQESNLMISASTDFSGVALSGVLKNIYSLGAGIGEALGWGSNSRAIYLSEAVKEMIAIGKIFGIKATTILGPAGLGDLLATALSRNSANNEIGRLIAVGQETDKKSEGLVSLFLLLSLLDSKAKNLYILQTLKKIVIDKESPSDVFKQAKFL